MTYQKEFPDFAPATMPTIPAGFEDKSWKNDAMPCFIHEALQLAIWVDFKNPRDREFPECPRYSVHTLTEMKYGHPGSCLVASDRWAEITACVEQRRKSTPPTWKCSRCEWKGFRADAAQSLQQLPVADGVEQVAGIMCPKCSAPLDPTMPLPAPEIVAERFAKVLREWAKDSEWEQMLEDNANETSANVCHSHDFCDANMAMDLAMRQLGINHEERWGDDWAANQEAADWWNASWAIATPKYLTKQKGQRRARKKQTTN